MADAWVTRVGHCDDATSVSRTGLPLRFEKSLTKHLSTISLIYEAAIDI